MCTKYSALLWFEMDQNFGSGRRKRGCWKIIISKYSSIRWKRRISSWWLQKIQGDVCLREDYIHSFPGKRVSHMHSPAIKWFMNVQMTHSAVLRWWTYGGTNWKETSEAQKAFLRSLKYSLSRMCNFGASPWRWRGRYVSSQASVVLCTIIFVKVRKWIQFVS